MRTVVGYTLGAFGGLFGVVGKQLILAAAWCLDHNLEEEV